MHNLTLPANEPTQERAYQSPLGTALVDRFSLPDKTHFQIFLFKFVAPYMPAQPKSSSTTNIIYVLYIHPHYKQQSHVRYVCRKSVIYHSLLYIYIKHFLFIFYLFIYCYYYLFFFVFYFRILRTRIVTKPCQHRSSSIQK